MRFVRAFAVQLRQALSWPLLLCGVLVAMVMELGAAGMIAQWGSINTVWGLVTSSGFPHMTLFVLPTLPFAMSLMRDWDSHAVPYWALRQGVCVYTTAKLLVCALSGCLTVGLGLILFVLVNGSFMPWFLSCSSCDYEMLFVQGHIFLGWFGYILHMALSGALTAALGMFMSILVPNRFVAVAAPLAIHLTVTRILPTNLISPTSIWHPHNWVMFTHYTGAPWQTLFDKFLLTAGFCGLMCVAGSLAVKRRMEHG